MNAADQAAELLAHEGVRLVLGQGAGAQVAELVRVHPESVESRTDTWFALALERWYADDITGARHWAERLVRDAGSGTADPDRQMHVAQIACIRLWRSRLGLEPMQPALDFAALAVADVADMADSGARAVLLTEVGITQNWLGELVDAERTLTSAISSCRSQDLLGLATVSMSHLAFTEFMAGRESGCVQVATDALAAVGSPEVRGLPFAGSRASLALLLGTLVDLPWPQESMAGPEPTIGRRVHSADLCAKFWMRMRDARLVLASGSVAEAERLLLAPTESFLPPDSDLPRHLRVVVLVERAMLAALSSDRTALTSLGLQLARLDAHGEAALARGLSCDLDGDRSAACAAFADAAAGATFPQPPTRALALTCEAQLLDALGDRDQALSRLRTAASECEKRRNAVPFLGWTRQGTPMKVLLPALHESSPSAWIGDLAEAARHQPDATAHFAALTATPVERRIAPEVPLGLSLSPREREVLGELARGSTYADIAANLFVSENTVKTHVSGLYAKLGVSRRRDALAVARLHNLL
jgi:DNA-binding CsgD family transcriptional regulator